MSLNGEKRRTKAIKRGGQHPEWDEEIRFTLLEDDTVEQPPPASRNGSPPPPPPKKEKGIMNIKGGKFMGLACYAEDLREPDLIGETKVDLTEVLTKGETDGESYCYASKWQLNHSPSFRMVHAHEQGQILRGGLPRTHLLVQRAQFIPLRVCSYSRLS